MLEHIRGSFVSRCCIHCARPADSSHYKYLANAALASFFYVTNRVATFVDSLFGVVSAVQGHAPTALNSLQNFLKAKPFF